MMRILRYNDKHKLTHEEKQMAGKQSKAMNDAQRLIEKGMSASDAAKKAGVSLGSIYLRPWWKAMQKAKEAANV